MSKHRINTKNRARLRHTPRVIFVCPLYPTFIFASFVNSAFFSLLDDLPHDPFTATALDLHLPATGADETMGAAGAGQNMKLSAPLAQLQACCARASAAASTTPGVAARGGALSASALLNGQGSAAQHRLLSRAHLEDRIACAIAIGSAPELVHWLRLYVRHLAAPAPTATSVPGSHGPDIVRLRTLCEKLLAAPFVLAGGDPHDARDEVVHCTIETSLSALWAPEQRTVLGLNKRQLLRAVVLPAFATNRSLQRLVSEYHEALSLVTAMDDERASGDAEQAL